MPHTPESRQAAGRIGALRTNAKAVDRKVHTQPARNARLQRYLDQVPAEITDPDDRMARALMLRKADMIAMSMLATAARRRAAQARKDLATAEAALRELDADGVSDDEA